MSNEILRNALGRFADPLPAWCDHQVVSPERRHIVSLGVEQAERQPHVCYVMRKGEGADDVLDAIRREIQSRLRRERDYIDHPRGRVKRESLVFDEFSAVVDVTDAYVILNDAAHEYASIDSTGSEEVEFSAVLKTDHVINSRRFATYHIEQE